MTKGIELETAKALKKSGFPIYFGLVTFPDGTEVAAWESYPDLKELIEACGDGFKNLCRDGKYWWANASFRIDNNDIQGWKSSTPEEAVANLWLALNKK